MNEPEKKIVTKTEDKFGSILRGMLNNFAREVNEINAAEDGKQWKANHGVRLPKVVRKPEYGIQLDTIIPKSMIKIIKKK